MPVDSSKAGRVWTRYSWCRDNGHTAYVLKADLCERHFKGDQWEMADRDQLRLVRRPALTINKILGTVSNVLGEQISNRSDIAYRPVNGSSGATADVLNKVFKHIAQNNQLDWKRSEWFADGVIGSRGYIDVRLGYDDNMQGEVKYELLNPKNVVVDPDADQYDPDTWSEVFITKWVTADDIAVLYNKDDAEYLRNREQSYFPYGFDSIETVRDRFGDRLNPAFQNGMDVSNVMRNLRVIERQYRELSLQKHFLDVSNGDTRPIPDEWDDNRIAALLASVPPGSMSVIKQRVRRIRWTAVCDHVVLHDDWSPYKHFTPVPFFPHFRRGSTIGLVENLTGPQELLNKVTSQELHVLNTVANSGWKVKAGTLLNMTLQELEARGAQTGIVLEVSDMDGAEKITPNATPQGLDRMSWKAEESIKSISGVSDSMQGFDREDVAAKAIQEKKKSGATNLVKPFDNLTRSDFILARNTLDLIQMHYTAPRILTIVTDPVRGTTEDVPINQVDPVTGAIINDLKLGEYHAHVTSVPHKETLEDSQFEQAVSLRELGVQIPDSVLIKASRLQDKDEILKAMDEANSSPEAQRAKQVAQATAEAEMQKTQGEAAVKFADAELRKAKTTATLVEANRPPEQEQDDGTESAVRIAEAQHDMDLKEREFEHKQRLDIEGLRMKREDQAQKHQLAAQQQAHQQVVERQHAAKMASKGRVEFNSPT